MIDSIRDISAQGSSLATKLRDFCRQGHEPPSATARQGFPTNETWQKLASTGTTLWLDTGDVDAISALWTQEFDALTTNNTLLNKEIQKGIYDDLMPRVADLLRDVEPDLSEELLVQEIAFALNAVHGLTLVRTFDADVSVELHTNLAYDTEASYEYGKRFWDICPDRFIVKVPLTPQGLIAARRLGQDGIRVNFTLGFSARQNYLTAKVARPSWVNVFMGRCNAFVSNSGLGDGANIGEKATLASQRAVREANANSGTNVRQIGASMRNGQQAVDLMGLDTYTIPTAVAEQYLEIDPAGEEMRDRTSDDPEVSLTRAEDLEGKRVDVFWRVDDEFRAAVDSLGQGVLDSMSGPELCSHLQDQGCADVFPELSQDDQDHLATDGKIPLFERWAARVESGELAWDSLLTKAGLASFTADQSALDQRIRNQL